MPVESRESDVRGPGFVQNGREFHGHGHQRFALLSPWAEAADKRTPDHEGSKFFRAVKNLTADGYYTTYVGLVQELRYKGNTALEPFPEANVPER